MGKRHRNRNKQPDKNKFRLTTPILQQPSVFKPIKVNQMFCDDENCNCMRFFKCDCGNDNCISNNTEEYMKFFNRASQICVDRINEVHLVDVEAYVRKNTYTCRPHAPRCELLLQIKHEQDERKILSHYIKSIHKTNDFNIVNISKAKVLYDELAEKFNNILDYKNKLENKIHEKNITIVKYKIENERLKTELEKLHNQLKQKDLLNLTESNSEGDESNQEDEEVVNLDESLLNEKKVIIQYQMMINYMIKTGNTLTDIVKTIEPDRYKKNMIIDNFHNLRYYRNEIAHDSDNRTINDNNEFVDLIKDLSQYKKIEIKQDNEPLDDKYDCKICNVSILKCNYNRHVKSKRHLKNMELNCD